MHACRSTGINYTTESVLKNVVKYFSLPRGSDVNAYSKTRSLKTHPSCQDAGVNTLAFKDRTPVRERTNCVKATTSQPGGRKKDF